VSTDLAPARRWRLPRFNLVGGIGATVWLVVVGVPLYALIAATLQKTDDYLDSGPLAVPTHPTLGNYGTVLSSDFPTYLFNTVIVTAVTVVLVLLLAVPVGYVVVRTRSRAARTVFRVFLLGLAIPAQAVIIPVYLIITKLRLYDSLTAVILPTAAFCLPVCVLILAGSMRDISEEMYEAMALDGAGQARVLLRLVIPMSSSGIATIAVYSALQAWNGFLFPLVLTQSQGQRVLTLGLYDYVGQFRIDIPALLAAVVLSMLPIFVVYLFARRLLVNGLMGVGGK
jgi:xylobiose transport system permease protein